MNIPNIKAATSPVAVLALLALSSLPAAAYENLEPRYWWEPSQPSQLYSTPDEALEAYRQWVDQNVNVGKPAKDRMTVLGYELVGSPGTSYWLINEVPSGYQIRFRRPSDCPDSCLAGGIFMKNECPVGTSPVTTNPVNGRYNLYCQEPAKPEPNLNECPAGGPIYPSTGMKWKDQTDYDGGPGNLRFTRTYRSDRNRWTHNYDIAAIDLPNVLATGNGKGACRVGIGRTTALSYCFRFISLNQPSDFAITRSDGRELHFNAATGLPVSSDVNDRLTGVTDNGGVVVAWDYYDSRDDSVHRFDPSGRLQTITARDGRVQSLSYSDGNAPTTVAPHAGLLIEVTDHAGKKLSFTYDPQGRMVTMTNPAGGVTTYAYDGASSIVVPGKLPVSNLTSVTYPDQTQRIYWYNEQDKTANTNLPFALTGITDESAIRYGTYKYDSTGRGVSTELADGLERYTLSYSGSQSTVTDPLGTQRTYQYTTVLGTKKRTSATGPCASGCSVDASATYDANGNVASKADFNGHKICYAYDLARNLETVRLEGLASGVSCPANLATYMPAAGTTQRKITTQWHATFRRPTQIDEAGKRTTYAHDSSGNVLSHTEIDTSANTSRTWTYTYNSFGRVLTVDGPRMDVTDVTTYAYYNCATGHQCGQVHTITNAAGHTTTYNTYNAHGQALTITDPNGVVTTLTYDPRQRLKSRTVGSEVTSFDYWPTGLLKKTALPDGSYLEYTYDIAHRLTGINDVDGNRIHYTLDSMGNRTKEESYDPS